MIGTRLVHDEITSPIGKDGRGEMDRANGAHVGNRPSSTSDS